jgi:hypothetical protein
LGGVGVFLRQGEIFVGIELYLDAFRVLRVLNVGIHPLIPVLEECPAGDETRPIPGGGTAGDIAATGVTVWETDKTYCSYYG